MHQHTAVSVLNCELQLWEDHLIYGVYAVPEGITCDEVRTWQWFWMAGCQGAFMRSALLQLCSCSHLVTALVGHISIARSCVQVSLCCNIVIGSASSLLGINLYLIPQTFSDMWRLQLSYDCGRMNAFQQCMVSNSQTANVENNQDILIYVKYALLMKCSSTS